MPVYEYVCSACGARVDVIHGIHASGPEACTVCGGPMRKAVSAPTIVFRGTGWAKKDARAAAASRDKPSSSDGSTDGDTDTAAKPEIDKAVKPETGGDREAAKQPDRATASGSRERPTEGRRDRDAKDRGGPAVAKGSSMASDR